MTETAQTKTGKVKRDTAGGKPDTMAALKAKEAKIRARIAQLQARENAKTRKEDNHLKILLGAAVLADSVKHPETRQTMNAILGRAISKPVDVDFLKSKGWL